MTGDGAKDEAGVSVNTHTAERTIAATWRLTVV